MDRIGDVILTIPLMRELRRNAPQARITWIVRPFMQELAERCPYVDEVLICDAGKIPTALQGRGFDLAIQPRWDTDLYGAGMLIYASQAKRRVGYSSQVSEAKKRKTPEQDQWYTDLLLEKTTKHEVERNLDVLRFLGGNIESDALEIWINSHEASFAQEVLKGEPYTIALGPGARSPKRMWPLKKFVEMSSWIYQTTGAQILVLGNQRERALGDQLSEMLPQVPLVNLSGQTSLWQAAAVLNRCQLYIGNDTGLMHLAAAAQTPVIGLSCHSKKGSNESPHAPIRFKPWSDQAVMLQPEEALAPCEGTCESNQAHCIQGIETEAVRQAVCDLIEIPVGSGTA